MAGLDHHALTLIVRWLHVAAMAIALGGALSVFVLSIGLPGSTKTVSNGELDPDQRDESGGRHAAVRPDPRGRVLVEAAARYEWAFWLAAGVLVMTGVGNLGAFGPALPGPSSDWGRTLDLKLAAVALVLLLSLPRSLVVSRLLAVEAGANVITLLRAAYGTTAAALAAVLAIAVGLAHG